MAVLMQLRGFVEVTPMMNKSLFLTPGLLLALLLCCATQAFAQTQAARILGNVSDPTGARIINAVVVLRNANGQVTTANTDRSGAFELIAHAPGQYTLIITAKGFAEFRQELDLNAGQRKRLDVMLTIVKQEERLEVTEDVAQSSADPANNAGAIVLKEKDLAMLSEDPDELKLQLQMLASASAGGQSGQILINGFQGTRLPPKSAIREIRINQDPFSAEYEQPGFGRIEVLTKPGASQFHSLVSFRYNNANFNSTSPFAAERPHYQTNMFSGSVGGPLSREASFQFDLDSNSINDSSLVNALTLDQNFNPAPFRQTIPNPRLFTASSLRVDYQLDPRDTFFARYQYVGIHERNDGTGQLAVASQGFDRGDGEHILQMSNTMVVNARMTNETRFQFERAEYRQTAQSLMPQINVIGAFIGGGNNLGDRLNSWDRYELQNHTFLERGNHLLRFGGQLRVAAESDQATPNFNGTFVFPSLQAFQRTQQGLQQGLTAAQIRALGGGADQFSIEAGAAAIDNTMVSAGVFGLDNWKLRPNVTLRYGLRYETQNGIQDRTDFAPRFGLAWGIRPQGKSAPKNVLRLGYGIFYTRFAQSLLLNAKQLDGRHQRQFIVPNPDFFPNLPDVNMLVASLVKPTIYQLDPSLRAPLLMQTSASYERKLPKAISLALTYVRSHGSRQLLSTNINAPLPGTFDPAQPTSGIRPFPQAGNIYQYQSRGHFNQHQLLAKLNLNGLGKVRLSGNYTLNFARSDTAGASSFPSNPFDLRQDYGRASYDIRHQLNFGGNIDLPAGCYLNPFLLVSSGHPFNLTLGRDLNGDSIFNDRPAFATDLARASVVKTAYGVFDLTPLPTQKIIPPNLATGPAQFALNLRLVKAFALGKKEVTNNTPKGSVYKQAWQPLYAIRFELIANNVFNRANLATPVGNLSSPLLGQSLALAGSPYSAPAAKRQIILRAVFRF